MNISKETVKRIVNDVKFIKNNTINNIFYKHDEENILNGYAIIIGNKDTPYEYGFYLFHFKFPTNYPYSPPTIKYMTNDGYMRFNPNLYTDGKVCLSVLNTWHGDGWSSCQSIYSILIVLLNILNANPLLNEPGINIINYKNSIDKYNLLVSYKNIEYSIIKQLKILCNLTNKDNNKDITNYLCFKKILIDIFKNNKNNILNNLNLIENDINKLCKNNYIYINTYNLECFLNINKLKFDINDLYNNI